MSKKMQNLVVLIEPSDDAWRTPLKGGNMILNRFCIDEDAAFELSGVYSLKKWSEEIERKWRPWVEMDELEAERKVKEYSKGKEYSFLRSYFILSK